MQVDAFGKIESCNSVIINQVKVENDISAIAYDFYLQRSNYENRNYSKRDNNYGVNKSNHYSVNDTQSVGTFISSNI